MDSSLISAKRRNQVAGIQTTLRPDYYEYFPALSLAELLTRSARLSPARATLLVPDHLASLGIAEDIATPDSIADVFTFVGISASVANALRTVYHAYDEFNGSQRAWVNRSTHISGETWLSSPSIHALMLAQLEQCTTPQRVLEIGVGTGLQLAAFGLLHPAAHLVGVDVTPGMPKAAKAFAKSLGVTLETHEDYAQRLKPQPWDLIYVTAAMRIEHVPTLARLSCHRPLYIQVPHSITPTEFIAEPNTSWLKRTFGTYCQYSQDQNYRRFLALSLFVVDHEELLTRQITLYDFTFVPYTGEVK